MVEPIQEALKGCEFDLPGLGRESFKSGDFLQYEEHKAALNLLTQSAGISPSPENFESITPEDLEKLYKFLLTRSVKLNGSEGYIDADGAPQRILLDDPQVSNPPRFCTNAGLFAIEYLDGLRPCILCGALSPTIDLALRWLEISGSAEHSRGLYVPLSQGPYADLESVFGYLDERIKTALRNSFNLAESEGGKLSNAFGL